MSLRALVVLNPVNPRLDRPVFEAALADAFGDGFRLCETTAGDECARNLDRSVAEAVRDGADLVVVAGGDGTVSLVVDRLLRLPGEGRPAIAIVPLGTANVLARELEVPIDAARAVALAGARTNERTLDAIRIGDRYYLTQVGTGLDARMIANTSVENRQQQGRWAYFGALLEQLTGYHAHRFDLTIDGKTYHKRAWQVIVANAKTLGAPPFTWGPGIDPGDGVLDVCVFNVPTPRDWITLFWNMLTRRHRPGRSARYFRVFQGAHIATRSPMPVQGDGDVIGKTPFEFSVAPGVVRVVAGPEEAPAAAAEPAETAGAAPVPEADLRKTVLQELAAFDGVGYLWVNRLHDWPPASYIARLSSRAMDHGRIWVAIAALFTLFDRRFGWKGFVLVVAPLWLAELTVNYPLKSLFSRRRPFVRYETSRVLARNRPLDSSFPSGHSASAMAGAVLLTPWAPVLAPLFFALAATVCVSRVYLGVHYPADVVLGAFAGVVLAIAFGTLVGLLLL